MESEPQTVPVTARPETFREVFIILDSKINHLMLIRSGLVSEPQLRSYGSRINRLTHFCQQIQSIAEVPGNERR